MSTMIQLPNDLTVALQNQASQQEMDLEPFVIDMLYRLVGELEAFPPLAELVAEIEATPPDPANFQPATASLADYLQEPDVDPTFDAAAWDNAWANVEAELKAINLAKMVQGVD